MSASGWVIGPINRQSVNQSVSQSVCVNEGVIEAVKSGHSVSYHSVSQLTPCVRDSVSLYARVSDGVSERLSSQLSRTPSQEVVQSVIQPLGASV